MDIKNPFPGLRAFTSEENHLFFGRHNHLLQVFNKLSKQRFVSIVGNSGSGKSSLVRAGILPSLNLEGGWQIATLRPGKDPIKSLAKTIIKTCNQSEDLVDEANATFKKSALGLVQWSRLAINKDFKLLILVDQFEEIFRYKIAAQTEKIADESEQFVSLLISAIQQREVPIYVIMTIRSDFLGECEQFAGLPESINEGQFLIPRMNSEELGISITGPIELVGAKISPRLVQRLIIETGNHPDQLPVLQHALMRTFEVWKSNQDIGIPIDIVHYEKTGTILNALSNHAEEAYLELETPEKQKLAKKIFQILTLKGEDGKGTRRPTAVTSIIKICNSKLEDVNEICEIFRQKNRGFLMPPDSVDIHENSVLDISHESLMRVWTRLRNWVNEEAENANLYKRITESALLFQEGKAGLWGDPDLQIAEDWLSHHKPNESWAIQYNNQFEIALKFIESSRDEKAYIASERKRKSNLAKVVLAIFLIALSALSIWAFLERNQAKKLEGIAQNEKQKAIQNSQLAKAKELEANTQKQAAETQKAEAEKQKKNALLNAEKAKLEKLKAERASLAANQARQRAELDKKIAILQKLIADSLKIVAEESSSKAYQLRILSLAQTLAIKSQVSDRETHSVEIKSLLALQASIFNKRYKGKTYDPEILRALQKANKTETEQTQPKNKEFQASITSICYLPNNSVAACSEDGSLFLYPHDARGTKIKLPQVPFVIKNLQASADGQYLVCTADDQKLIIYSLSNLQQNPSILNLEAGAIIRASKMVSNVYYFGLQDGSLLGLNLKNKKIDPIAKTDRPITSIQAINENALLVGTDQGKLLGLTLNQLEWKDYGRKVSERVTSICYINDQELVAVAYANGAIYSFSFKGENRNGLPEKLSEVNHIKSHEAAISALHYSPKNNVLISASLDGTIKIRPLDLQEENPLVLKEHESWVNSLALSLDGDKIISGGKDKILIENIISESLLVKELKSKTSRNFTLSEWLFFIGNDIPYEETL